MRLPYPQSAAGLAALLLLVATAVLAEPPQGPARSSWAARAAVSETEPNNTPGTADELTTGDTVTGTLPTWEDVDYFAVSLTAGALVRLDLRSQGYYYISLVLLGTDGTTVLRYAENSSGGSHLELSIPATGRYYARVSSYYSATSYVLTVGVEPPGPGEPTTVFVDGLGVPWAMAADRTGDLFVIDRGGNRIARVAPNGTAETWVTLPTGSYANDIALDALGDVLVAALSNGAGIVWRYDRETRSRSRFTARVPEPTALAIGPDGDIWVAGYYPPRLWRFDPAGAVKDSIPVPYTGTSIFDAAFSPEGVLHYSSGSTVWRLTDREPEPTVQQSGNFLGLAFDRDGQLYTAHAVYASGSYQTSVYLVTPTDEQPGAAFARTNLAGSVHLAFARDETGVTTSRLLAANGYYYYGYGTPPPGTGAIVAMNPEGVESPGWPVGVDFLIAGDAPPGLVGAAYADTLRITGTTGVATWRIAAGQLPTGLTLDSLAGVISGTPEQAGAFEFTAQARVSDRAALRVLTIQVAEPELRVTDAIDALMGVPQVLSPALERFLDLQGNRNGRFDVGDVQAYLRAKGKLPQAPVAVPSREEL